MSEKTINPSPIKARLLSRAMRTPTLFQGLLWTRMPLLAMIKPRMRGLDQERCEVEIPFRYRNRNIFGTMYFAATLMAAELTTGGLVLFHNAARPEKVKFIVKGIEADFVKPARSRVTFVCDQGEEVRKAFEEALRGEEGVERTLEVSGRRADGEEVARVKVNWYWRAK